MKDLKLIVFANYPDKILDPVTQTIPYPLVPVTQETPLLKHAVDIWRAAFDIPERRTYVVVRHDAVMDYVVYATYWQPIRTHVTYPAPALDTIGQLKPPYLIVSCEYLFSRSFLEKIREKKITEACKSPVTFIDVAEMEVKDNHFEAMVVTEPLRPTTFGDESLCLRYHVQRAVDCDSPASIRIDAREGKDFLVLDSPYRIPPACVSGICLSVGAAVLWHGKTYQVLYPPCRDAWMSVLFAYRDTCYETHHYRKDLFQWPTPDEVREEQDLARNIVEDVWR